MRRSNESFDRSITDLKPHFECLISKEFEDFTRTSLRDDDIFMQESLIERLTLDTILGETIRVCRGKSDVITLKPDKYP